MILKEITLKLEQAVVSDIEENIETPMPTTIEEILLETVYEIRENVNRKSLTALASDIFNEEKDNGLTLQTLSSYVDEYVRWIIKEYADPKKEIELVLQKTFNCKEVGLTPLFNFYSEIVTFYEGASLANNVAIGNSHEVLIRYYLMTNCHELSKFTNPETANNMYKYYNATTLGVEKYLFQNRLLEK